MQLFYRVETSCDKMPGLHPELSSVWISTIKFATVFDGSKLNCAEESRNRGIASYEHDSHFPDERILHHPRATDIQVPIPFKIRLARAE